MAITPEQHRQHQKIMQHIRGRFATLKRMLEENSRLRVIIAGDPADKGKEEGEKISRGGLFYKGARGHRLGCGLAHVQYGNADLWLEMVQLIDQEVNGLFEKYSDRVSCGEVSGAQCDVNNIHVFGANADNWNRDERQNGVFGEGQAAHFNQQKPGVFGIVTTPIRGVDGIEEVNWKWYHNWDYKSSADKKRSVNTRYWYQDGGDGGNFDLVNTISAYALEGGFRKIDDSPGDESLKNLYKKGKQLVGVLAAAGSLDADTFKLGQDEQLKKMISKMEAGGTAKIFLPTNVLPTNVLPTNVGGNHWVMIEMNFAKDESNNITFSGGSFYDSLPNQERDLTAFKEALGNALKSIKVDKELFRILECAKQTETDGTSCGPIACWYAGQSIGDLGVEEAAKGQKAFSEGAEELRKHQAEIVAKYFKGYVIGAPNNSTPQPPGFPRPKNAISRTRAQRVAQRGAQPVNQQQPKSASKKRTLSDFKIADQGVILTVSDQQDKEIIEKLEKDETWKVENGRVQTTDEYKKQWLSYYYNNTRHADKEAIKKRTITENNKNGIDIDPKRTSPSPNLIKVLSVIALQASKDREEKSSAK